MADKTCPQRTKNVVECRPGNVGLNDSLVNLPKTCQQRCEINIYVYKNTYFTTLYLRCHNRKVYQ